MGCITRFKTWSQLRVSHQYSSSMQTKITVRHMVEWKMWCSGQLVWSLTKKPKALCLPLGGRMGFSNFTFNTFKQGNLKHSSSNCTVMVPLAGQLRARWWRWRKHQAAALPAARAGLSCQQGFDVPTDLVLPAANGCWPGSETPFSPQSRTPCDHCATVTCMNC